MATRRLSNPARALTRIVPRAARATQPSPYLSTAAIGPYHGPRGVPVRGYATGPQRVKVSAEFFGELDISSVREEDLWSYKQKHPHLLRYDPAEYISCLEIFYAMGKRARFDWPLAIKKEYRPSKEMLNDLGCYLSEEYFSIRRRPEQHKLAVALYSGASAMGCEASCVSIVSMLANSPTPASAYKAPLFKPTMSFFRDIVNKGENPYALTIEGLFLLKEKKPNATIRVLERAIQLGGPDFPWKASCWHDIGGAYVAIGDHCKAEEYYEMAASAGSRDAWHQLAHTADKTPEEQRDALYKSGCLGERVAFRNLSVAFVIASKADGVTSEQKLDYFRFNEEADRLSGQSADKWY